MKIRMSPLLGASLAAAALPRYAKRSLAILIDIGSCLISVWLAFFLRIGESVSLFGDTRWAVVACLCLAIPIFSVSGLYHVIFRYSGSALLLHLLKTVAVYGFLYSSLITFVTIPGIPRTIGLIQPLLLFALVASSRLFVEHWFRGINNFQKSKLVDGQRNALIYGAGEAGRQLFKALRENNEFKVVGFLDDDSRIQNTTFLGVKISPPTSLPAILKSAEVSHLLLAVPTAERKRRTEIINFASEFNLVVRSLPTLAELASGRVSVTDLRDLDIVDLLGRQQVSPNEKLLAAKVAGKKVLVSGAGGSIGAELCRQISNLHPTSILLVESNEYALYQIYNELISSTVNASKNYEVIALLCNVQDGARMRAIFDVWRPDTIYHAAAYKHVDLVEHNVVEGLRNNVLGTLVAAQAASDFGVSDFVLVSTDKAVRPTNVMGATKRFAEIILQAISSVDDCETCFSIVRFGNVLASSGSVIPKFAEQISKGGPITVTHPEITRFFMTISEASQLVLQASSLADGGDVFVLDMGEPVRILALAERMVRLSGLTVKNSETGDGDIEIKLTGLRPGEKLFEELLIGNDPLITQHPKIMRANEELLGWDLVCAKLQKLDAAISEQDVQACLLVLNEVVSEFTPHKHVVDWIHTTKSKAVSLS